MPRSPRHWVPGAGAHIVSRFVDRRFHLQDSTDRQLLFNAIGRADHRWNWRWLSWALMSSHVHYGTIASALRPDNFFRSAHTRFATAYHRRRKGQTLGPVFADRPSLWPVSSGRLSRMVAYHHRNPVEAGVVERPSEWRWTSHLVYLRRVPAPAWFDVEWALDVLGFVDTEAGRRRFDAFVMELDLDAPWCEGRPQDECERTIGPVAASIGLDVLVTLAREIADLGPHVPIDSRRHAAVRMRYAVARVATRDLAERHVDVARELRMSPGGLSNLMSRRSKDSAASQLAERLRLRLEKLTTR